ncbi:hypothetical protein KJ853_01050 [Patescibacteria group bacterium]|nr:hypothetical protein [Patescibacteria group bacterium]
MNYVRYIKFGLICVAIFEIAVLFYSLHIYNKFVSNPDNYYKNSLTKYEQLENQEKQ